MTDVLFPFALAVMAAAMIVRLTAMGWGNVVLERRARAVGLVAALLTAVGLALRLLGR